MEKTNLFIGISEGNEINIDAQKLATGRTCVIAQSGAGKSYLIAVLCEELLKNNVPFCIIDTEGEYFSLREKFKVLWIGGKNADINIENTNLEKLASMVIEGGIPMILDVSDVLDEVKFVSEFTDHLYDVADKLRTPYLLMVEESDKFIPQSKESIKKIEEIARRGRKRGLGLLLATQRPALVNKNVLAQCGNQLIGKLTTENDLQAVNLFFGSRKELEELPELEPGEFFVMGDISKKKVKVKVKERVTKHKGMTPILIPKRLGKFAIKDLLLKKGDKLKPEEPDEKAVKIKTIHPKITKGQAINIASPKRSKKYIFFGEKEDIRYVELQMHPMFYIDMKISEGILKKKNKKYSLIIDGNDGRIAEINNGLKYKKGFEKFIGLNENEIKVLLMFGENDVLNAEQIRDDTKMSLKNVKTVLKKLEKKDIVDYIKDSKSYEVLEDIRVPDIRQHQSVNASEVEISAKPVKAEIKENNIRDIIKALERKSEILKLETFYYPIFSVHFERRIINIDAISGKILS